MKKLMMAACVALVALGALAEPADRYFYWYVMSADAAFSYAKLAYSVGGAAGGYLTIDNTTAAAVAADESGTATDSVFARLGSDVEWGEDFTFLVETYDEESAMLGRSSPLAYGDILGYLYDYESMFDVGGGVRPMGIAVGQAAVPEPTGGTLLLLGFAALALRRRRGK